MQALRPPQLDIWLTRLGPSCLDLSGEAAQANFLSDQELAHAQKFSHAAARERYLQVRTEVRRCLALYTGLQPQELVFGREAGGKPVLINTPQPLSFNLSHSGDYLALAVSAAQAVGIDLEHTSERQSWRAIAERYFHPEEVTQLRARPEAEQRLCFYHWWTLKEAFFKARGTGIATGLDKAVFSFNDCVINCRFAPELLEDSDSWQFQLWQWNPGYHLALAWKNAAANQAAITFYLDRKAIHQNSKLPKPLAGSKPLHALDTR